MVIAYLVVFSVAASHPAPTGIAEVGRAASTPPVMKDPTGNNLSSASAGQLVMLSSTILNNNDIELPFTAFIEVRDEKGATVYLQWQTGKVNPNGESEVGLSWTPEKAGEYEFRTFLISNFTRPQILTAAESSMGTIA
jgi:hypothetical protein